MKSNVGGRRGEEWRKGQREKTISEMDPQCFFSNLHKTANEMLSP